MDQEQPTPEPALEEEPAAATDDPVATEPPRPGSRRRIRIAVALTLAAAVVLLVGLQVSGLVRILGGPSGASTVALPPRIAIVDGAGVLATMDDRGGSVLRHPVSGVELTFPAWSPDGSRVAAIGSSTDAGGIYVFQTRGEGGADPATATDPTVIYRSETDLPFYLYWTPDSRNVAFLAQKSDGLALRVAPADGSSPGAVLREGAPLYWDWVDPGRALVHVGAGTSAFLGEIGLDGAAGQPDATTPGLFRSPSVTHDGSRRAFMIDMGGGKGSVVVESRDGSNHHEIAIPGIAALTFAPTGASLAFIAPDAQNAQLPDLPIGSLRVVDVASGSVRTIQGGSIIAFFWSPDGRTIATLRVPAPGENGVASIAGNARPPALLPASFPPAAIGSGYDVSLAFIDAATGTARSTKTVRISQLFGLQILPYFDQYALSHRFWSPDSAEIVLPLVSAEGVDGLVVLPADGSAERRLGDGEMASWSP